MPKTSQHHLAQSGVDSAEDRNDSDLAIQSMIELEEKRLERMLTPNEVDNIVRRFSSPDETDERTARILQRDAEQMFSEMTNHMLQVEAEKSKKNPL